MEEEPRISPGNVTPSTLTALHKTVAACGIQESGMTTSERMLLISTAMQVHKDAVYWDETYKFEAVYAVGT